MARTVPPKRVEAPVVDPDIATWVIDGEHDPGRWAANGLGIFLHDKQIEVIEELLHADHEAVFNLLTWANRSGKSVACVVVHLHRLFYKWGLPKPETEQDYKLWLAEDYRTLHTAPLNELAGRAWQICRDILTGTSPAQRTEDGKRRDAPLAPMYIAKTERDQAGADRMVVRCVSGAVMDFRSTEGGGGRIEGGAWRFATWDEWGQQENVDDIRLVLNRLQTRVSDFEGKLLLTGTITEEVEHIAKEWIAKCEDTEDTDWWGTTATRLDNPSASRKAIGLAERTLGKEDYDRTVLGKPGGVRGRVFPAIMLDPIFANDLPRFSPPAIGDGAVFSEGIRGPRARGVSEWTYLHVWDVAIATAENIGMVVRVPASGRFDPEHPLIGVQMKVVPGSRTLLPSEIIHSIEETYLPFGGEIHVDTTDAHGKGIARELRQAGYPAHDFDFHGRDSRGVIAKDRAIQVSRRLVTEGLTPVLDGRGEVKHDAQGVPLFEPATGAVGILRLPASWTKARDQLAVLRPDDSHQKKDAAMVVLMVLYRAWKLRARAGRPLETRLPVFAR